MSQRLPASHPVSRATTDGRGIILPPVHLRDDAYQRGEKSERPQSDSDKHVPHSQLHLTSQGLRSTALAAERSPSNRQRDLGVHSMLNPTVHSDSRASGCRPGENTETYQSSIGGRLPFTSQISLAGQQASSSNIPSVTESNDGNFAWAQRRVLTQRPRSPSQIVGAGRVIGPDGIHTLRSPFLPPRGLVDKNYDSIQLSSSKGSPTPNNQVTSRQQPQSNHSIPHSELTSVRRSYPQSPTRTQMSLKLSPKISKISHSRPIEQNSPAHVVVKPLQAPQAPQTNAFYYPGSNHHNSTPQVGTIRLKGSPGNPETPYVAPVTQPQCNSLHSSSVCSSRQTSASDPIQVLTLTTSQGSYAVPVNVHHASRLADEKRARNAGASARFRQRRKEKEIEANSAIEKLQCQVKDLERSLREAQSERNFYRSERDRLREAVFRTSETKDLAIEVSPTPNLGRSSPSQSYVGIRDPPEPPPPPIRMEEDRFERANRRRRTHIEGNFIEVSSMGSSVSPQVGGFSSSSAREVNHLPRQQQSTKLLLPEPLNYPRLSPTIAPSISSSIIDAHQGPYDPCSRQGGWSRTSGGRQNSFSENYNPHLN